MRKLRLVFACAALFAASCSINDDLDNVESTQQELTIHAYREDDSITSKTTRREDGSVWWVPMDSISVFYKSGSNGGNCFVSCAHDTVKTTDFAGTINLFTGGCEHFPDGNYLWGLYPYCTDASCDGTSVTMTLPYEQVAVPGTFETGLFPSIGRSRGLNMGFYNICGGLKFTVTMENVKRVILKSRNREMIAGRAKVTFNEDGIPMTEIIDGRDEIILNAPAGKTFEVGKPYFIVMFPTTLSGGFTFTIETYFKYAIIEKTNTIIAKRSIFGSIPDIDAGIEYSYKSNIQPPEAVDLGLSVKWASFNVGSASPEGFGDYFAWGETNPYYDSGSAYSATPVWMNGKEQGYSWASYRWCNGTRESLTKYNTNSSYGIVDNLTLLEIEDDAAHENWGGTWRLPTKDEWEELMKTSNCAWTRTRVNGVQGYMVTSKKEGYTDKSIFLPGAGYRYELNYKDDGFGYYWSASISGIPYYAQRLFLGSTKKEWFSSSRFAGSSIRPVTE